jgi:hypothetical protein
VSFDLNYFTGPNSGAYREGDLKLIIGRPGISCYDTDYPLEPSKTCRPGKPDPHPVDWHCTPCTETKEQRDACPASAPCLFNVSSQADPLEEHDLSMENPQVVASMRATYNKLGEQACAATLGPVNPSIPSNFARFHSLFYSETLSGRCPPPPEGRPTICYCPLGGCGAPPK